MGLFGPPSVTKVVLNRDYEAEHKRNMRTAFFVINGLFPDNKKDTKTKNSIKRRLKNNPKMTAVIAALIGAGVILTAPIVVNLVRKNTPALVEDYKRLAGFTKGPQRKSRKRKKSKRKKSKKKY
jgi:hypothetical protein